MDSKIDSSDITSKVDELYDFKDLYFESNPIEQAHNKNRDIRNKMDEVVNIIEENQSVFKSKAEYCMLKGKCFNVLPDYSLNAEEALSKAVKLDPKLVEAWNQLGECYWKKGDINSAKDCFTGALQHSKNKVSLRNLSMVLRQLGTSNEEKLNFIKDSLTKAKEALELDIKDGTSWYILGNAYLSIFFQGPKSSNTLQQCYKAYTQAEKDRVAKNNPDLHYNRAMLHLYEGNFIDGICGFKRAKELDPSWEDAGSKCKLTEDYLKSAQDMVLTKAKMAGKSKLQKVISALTESDLGPYGGGSYTSPRGDTVPLELKPFSAIQIGVNSNCVVCGKVIGSLYVDPVIPYTFVIIDKQERCMAICLYNVSAGYGVKFGDSVAIPEPFVMSADLNFEKGAGDNNSSKYDFIRVENPTVLVVNGKKLGTDKQAPVVLNITVQGE